MVGLALAALLHLRPRRLVQQTINANEPESIPRAIPTPGATGRLRKCRRRAPALPWAKTSGVETRAVYKQNSSAIGRFEVAVRRGQRCGRAARASETKAALGCGSPHRAARSRNRQREAPRSAASRLPLRATCERPGRRPPDKTLALREAGVSSMSALITRTAGEVVTTSGRLPQAAKRLPSALLTSDGHRRRGGRHGLSERPPGTGDRAPSSPDRRVVDVSGAGPTSSLGPGCMRIGRPGPPRDARGQAKDVSRPGWRGRTRIGHRGRRPRSVSVAGARRRRVRTPDRHPVQRMAVPHLPGPAVFGIGPT